MSRRRKQLSRIAFRLMEIALGLVFLAVVAHHILTADFKPLAALCIPILAVYYGFASLLFARGRALSPGPWQMRSLYAAERTIQAAVWHLFGIVLGASIYGLLRQADVALDRSDPLSVALWLLLFLVPYALMQIGLIHFLRAIWAIAPHLVRSLGAFEIRRRVQQR